MSVNKYLYLDIHTGEKLAFGYISKKSVYTLFK